MVELFWASVKAILNAAHTVSPCQLGKYHTGKLLAIGEVADFFVPLVFGDDAVKRLPMKF